VINLQLPPTTGKVTISTSGSGIAIVQVSTIYHLNTVEQANRPFDLEFQVTNTSTQHCMELQICPKQWQVQLRRKVYFKRIHSTHCYITSTCRSNVREGNIGIIVINLPSGYIAKENIDSGLEMIKRVEIREAGTVLDVYFEQVRFISVDANKYLVWIRYDSFRWPINKFQIASTSLHIVYMELPTSAQHLSSHTITSIIVSFSKLCHYWYPNF